jgi:hypothetical protein
MAGERSKPLRRGCISLGNINCDVCHRKILYPERYLSLEETKGKSQTLCMTCCEARGLVQPESSKENAEKLFDLSSD